MRILVVEKDQQVRHMIVHVLSAIPGCEIIGVPNGQEALNAVSARRPDLITTDLNLSGLDGIELIKRLRSNCLSWNIPVTVITAGPRGAEALDTGGWVLLRKPFSVYHLLSIAESALR